jgi:GntR family transcriptional regulator of arabinose operon
MNRPPPRAPAQKPSPEKTRSGPKYKQIYALLRQAIEDNRYPLGSRLPSENEMVEQFHASRPTIGRALAQLESEGLIDRRAGSGTFVTRRNSESSLVFGLLIPQLGETEIFEPICRGISKAGAGSHHELIWGPLFPGDTRSEVQAERLCEYYLSRELSGVFFAPLELSAGKDAVNLRIVRAFDEAGIPVVLLDRDICDYPGRSRYDLVGLDNRRAGRAVTEHLIAQGARRIVFFGRPYSAPTVTQRILGYRDAIYAAHYDGLEPAQVSGDAGDRATVDRLILQLKPDAIVCANDYTAAQMMTTLDTLGVAVPSQVRVTGMDDVKYAGLLNVPLTTIRQSCMDLGATALLAMRNRVAHPTLPALDFIVDFELIVRTSSGVESEEGETRRTRKQKLTAR